MKMLHRLQTFVIGLSLLSFAGGVPAQPPGAAGATVPPVETSAEQTQRRLEERQALNDAQERRALERASARNPFSITTYRRNYLLPITYNFNPDEQSFRDISDEGIDNAEVKFQFSAKFNLAKDLFGNNGDLYFAYTQRSWWQAYNSEASSPFRETNFEPEVFLSFDNNFSWLGWTNTHNRIGFNHQSNGRSNPLSRSWNRLYVEGTFQKGDWAVVIAPHWRIPESDDEDDNPDIERYVGYGDVTLARRLFDDQEATLTWRGNPRTGYMGVQADYSWPLFNSVRGHVQYYYGYGESLVDYNHRNNRLGIGFSINPFFAERR